MHNLKVKEQHVWQGTYLEVPFKVVKWNLEHIGDIWNYYVYLPETKCKDFDSLWLEDTEFQFTPNSPKRITHDYYSVGVFQSIEFHGGITWYDKRGYIKGHRVVEIGCDYNHYRDQEKKYNLDDILTDVEHTCSLVKELIFK